MLSQLLQACAVPKAEEWRLKVAYRLLSEGLTQPWPDVAVQLLSEHQCAAQPGERLPPATGRLPPAMGAPSLSAARLPRMARLRCLWGIHAARLRGPITLGIAGGEGGPCGYAPCKGIACPFPKLPAGNTVSWKLLLNGPITCWYWLS